MCSISETDKETGPTHTSDTQGGFHCWFGVLLASFAPKGQQTFQGYMFLSSVSPVPHTPFPGVTPFLLGYLRRTM